MKLVSSNDPSFVQDTIREAMRVYHSKSDASKALDILTKLKGIGPATASLLLTVHDPDKVIFFSDEAFYWLCCGGKKAPIKYNAKEYQELNSKAQALAQKLGVKATEVEKAAYVIMKQLQPAPSTAPSKAPKTAPAAAKTEAKREPKIDAAKRKESSDGEPDTKVGLRRSKRGKGA
jgi:hypothetical protein